MKKVYLFPSLVALMLVSFITFGCNQRISDKIDLAALAISEKDFPPGWSFSGIGERGIEYYRSLDSISVFFNPDSYPDSHNSVQSIYRFKSIKKAKRDFADELEFFKKFYSVPPEWVYRSILADESYFTCREEAERCLWIARYGDVVIDFQAPVTPELMTLQDFENIVKLIDLKAGQLILNKNIAQ